MTAYLSTITKQDVARSLRRVRLLDTAERGRYWWNRMHGWAMNRAFSRSAPGFALPPPHLAYDAYGIIDWQLYRDSGIQHARFYAHAIKRFLPAQEPLHVCEWGCGPARIIRHMPQALGGAHRYTGTDYNAQSIEWCQGAVPGVSFFVNGLEPPLPFPDHEFDAVYCFSVFTHLSARMHAQWMAELRRVIKPAGIALITTHGDAFRTKLVRAEADRYDRGELVVRGEVTEGKRGYTAFHPETYVRDELLEGAEILEHLRSPLPQAWFIQDLWVVRFPAA